MTATLVDAVVWVNGAEVVRHKDDYTPFEARLTAHLHDGDNLVTVRIDGSENPVIPPFGGQIDYLTYAGIYRDVHLRVTPPLYIANAKVETPDPLVDHKTVRAKVFLGGSGAGHGSRHLFCTRRTQYRRRAALGRADQLRRGEVPLRVGDRETGRPGSRAVPASATPPPSSSTIAILAPPK